MIFTLGLVCGSAVTAVYFKHKDSNWVVDKLSDWFGYNSSK